MPTSVSPSLMENLRPPPPHFFTRRPGDAKSGIFRDWNLSIGEDGWVKLDDEVPTPVLHVEVVSWDFGIGLCVGR